ncbi:MAG: hypothetical protein ACR2HX_21080 [Pyrinomonadaceae bacterium]
MKRNAIIIVALLAAFLLVATYYLYWGSAVPPGQQPLVILNGSNFSSLKDEFNKAADSARVVVMLSPT